MRIAVRRMSPVYRWRSTGSASIAAAGHSPLLVVVAFISFAEPPPATCRALCFDLHVQYFMRASIPRGRLRFPALSDQLSSLTWPPRKQYNINIKATVTAVSDCVQMDETGRTSRRVMERLLRTRWRHWISRRLRCLSVWSRCASYASFYRRPLCVTWPQATLDKLLMVDIQVRPQQRETHHFVTLRSYN